MTIQQSSTTNASVTAPGFLRLTLGIALIFCTITSLQAMENPQEYPQNLQTKNVANTEASASQKLFATRLSPSKELLSLRVLVNPIAKRVLSGAMTLCGIGLAIYPLGSDAYNYLNFYINENGQCSCPNMDPSKPEERITINTIHNELRKCGVPEPEKIIIRKREFGETRTLVSKNNRYIYTFNFIDGDWSQEEIDEEYKNPTQKATVKRKGILNHEAGHIVHNDILRSVVASCLLTVNAGTTSTLLLRGKYYSKPKIGWRWVAQEFSKPLLGALISIASIGAYKGYRIYREQCADDYITDPLNLVGLILKDEDLYKTQIKEIGDDFNISQDTAKRWCDIFPLLMLKYDPDHPPVNLRLKRQKARLEKIMGMKIFETTSSPPSITEQENATKEI